MPWEGPKKAAVNCWIDLAVSIQQFSSKLQVSMSSRRGCGRMRQVT